MLSKKHNIILFSLFALLAIPMIQARAGEVVARDNIVTQVLSLNSAVEEARRENPEILAAKRHYEAAKARISQELVPEDPVVEYIYDEMRAGVPGLMGKPMRSYGISQKTPFPSKLILRSNIAAKDTKISYEGYKEKERDVIARTKIAYVEAWYIDKALGITKENQALLEQFCSSTASRYSLNKASEQDALKAQVELAKVKNSIILLDQKRQIAQAKLNMLLNRDPCADIAVDKNLDIPVVNNSLESLIDTAKINRPKLRAFRYAVEKGRVAYLLAWNEFLPDIHIRYQQMIMDGSGDKWAGMLGMSVPIWFWTKQASGVKEMKSELDMFRAEYNMMENMAVFDVKDAYARVESYKKLVSTFETSFIPQAEQALKASLTGFEAGQIDFLNLLDSQRMLLDIKVEYYKMIFDLCAGTAELEMSVGVNI
ncbi:MAG: TolC family protein [Candidatus Omnitrophica bacterium]|nr:TolC family protein [Candidatus Omnitrophota bacterium]